MQRLLKNVGVLYYIFKNNFSFSSFQTCLFVTDPHMESWRRCNEHQQYDQEGKADLPSGIKRQPDFLLTGVVT